MEILTFRHVLGWLARHFGKFENIKDNKNEKLLKILDFLHVKTSPDIIVQIDGSSRMTKKKENKYVLQGDEK